MARQQIDTKELLGQALSLEKAGNLQEAVSLYEEVLKHLPANVEALNRLMIIYRKQKEYRKELAIIKKAIKNYEAQIIQRQKASMEKHRSVLALSKKLAKSLGLLDRKGFPIYGDENLARWEKRKATVLKRLGK